MEAAVTCCILAAAGPQRSRVLANLYKDERTRTLPVFPFLEKVYLERILQRAEVQLPSTLWRCWQAVTRMAWHASKELLTVMFTSEAFQGSLLVSATLNLPCLNLLTLWLEKPGLSQIACPSGIRCFGGGASYQLLSCQSVPACCRLDILWPAPRSAP